tara:strand:- start:12112 stop:13029 length:918 start_codon:yes stop_codon:yes gene_type:complete
MKILIFGSKGLVGSSLNRILTKNTNYKIISSSREDTDLFNTSDTFKKINSVQPDIIINAAARVGGIYANDTYRSQFLIENLKINLNILEACLSNPSIKIINLGSSCIYPLEAQNPISEENFMNGKLEPTNSPYAMAKLTAIELGNSMKLQYGTEVINLMPTNLYGPNDSFSDMDSHVIPGLIHRMHSAKENQLEKFKIWGTGKPLREFLYVDDLSKAIEFIINKNISENILNIGSGEEVSIKDLASLIKETIGYSGELLFDDTKPDGNPRKLLDSSRFNNYGWTSSVKLKDGLTETYKWYLENII